MASFNPFNFSKEGLGVYKDDKQKTGFFLFWDIYFSKFFKICGLTALYLFCCIPIVTIGPATAGYTYIMRNYARVKHAYNFSDYFETIKRNFKVSFFAGLIDIFVTFIISVNIVFYTLVTPGMGWGDFSAIAVGFVSIIYLFYIFIRFYVYTLLVTFDLKFWKIYKNSLYLTMLGIKKNLFIVLGSILFTTILAFIFMIFGLIDKTLFLSMTFTTVAAIFLPCGMLGLWISINTWGVIEKYMVEPFSKDTEDGYNTEKSEDINDVNRLFADTKAKRIDKK